jgi:hypothetical protein
MTVDLAFVHGLLACGLPPTELAAQIKAQLPAANAAKLEHLISIAPAAKLQAVVTAYVNGLVKAEKADAKRKRDRENIAAKRGGGGPRDMRDSRDIGDSATRKTSATRATRRHRDSPPAYTSPPVEISEPKKVLRSLSISTHPLPADFKLTADDIEFALLKVGWDQQQVDHQFSRFCDHYRASGACKADWHAAWRNWVTNPLSRQQPLPLPPPIHLVESNEHEQHNR